MTDNENIKKINKITHIFIKCSTCKREFYKSYHQYKRNTIKKALNYCSYKCSNASGDGKYSEFLEYMRRIKNRDPQNNISLEYLDQLWRMQKGRCVYTDINLNLASHKRQNKVYTASVDKINPKGGYLKGNIQFVSTAINLMKSTLTHDEMNYAIKVIKKYGQEKDILKM